jgi:phosphatidylglycerophosphatase A
LATCFGVGRVPFASGTVASALALPFAFLLVLMGAPAMATAAALASAVGVWACGQHCTKLGICDSSECVLDEVAGQWIALVPIALYARPFNWGAYALGFLLFRAVDVLKLWPMSAAERLPGGYGVMADDVLAGIFTAACLWGALANGWV